MTRQDITNLAKFLAVTAHTSLIQRGEAPADGDLTEDIAIQFLDELNELEGNK